MGITSTETEYSGCVWDHLPIAGQRIRTKKSGVTHCKCPRGAWEVANIILYHAENATQKSWSRQKSTFTAYIRF